MQRLTTDMDEACLHIDKDCRLVDNDYLINHLHIYYFPCFSCLTKVITCSDNLRYGHEMAV